MTGRTACSIPCNLCGSESVEEISLRDREGQYLRTVICTECGLIWSDPRPSDERIEHFYAKRYRKEYKGITRPKKKHVYRHAKNALKRYAFFRDVVKEGDRLLDIGAGNGVFVYCLRGLGVEASGIEPDEGHSRYAREELHVPVETGFSRDIDRYGTFDIITLNHVLEHMIDPFAELRHLWALLKSGGSLVVDVPNAEDLKQDPKNRYHKAHLYTFNPESLSALGEKAGFRVFRRETERHNGNISMLFRKSVDPPAVPGDLSGNCARILGIIGAYTRLRHFASAIPYKKLLENAATALDEQVAVRRFNRHRDIIDAVLLSCRSKDGGGAVPRRRPGNLGDG
ncbi:Methyltransferase type 11 [uncultured Desulfatiglans sp.]|nr:Methyltransferase type 11 [uncultured Desulfatiglans sp.]